MRNKIFILAVVALFITACGRSAETLTRMECVVDGEVQATLRFEYSDGALAQAQLFDASRQWLFTVQPEYAGHAVKEVVYNSSEESQRATYHKSMPDSLIAMFVGKGDFHSNSMRLDKRDRVVERRLLFRQRDLAYHVDVSWDDDTPSRIAYSYNSTHRGREVSQGGELLYHAEQGQVRRIEVRDDAMSSRGDVEIVCHYGRTGGGGPYDWSEKAFYLPTPMLLLTAWSVHSVEARK